MSAIEKISVSVKEAAEATGLSTWQIYELTNKGLIEKRYQGSKILIPVTALKAYIESLPTEPPP